MDEDLFYEYLDKAEEINLDITASYYPTIEELETLRVKDNVEKFFPILSYFASDPFKRQNNFQKDDVEYKSMVKYVRDIVNNIELD